MFIILESVTMDPLGNELEICNAAVESLLMLNGNEFRDPAS
jgi:hypothetical protein